VYYTQNYAANAVFAFCSQIWQSTHLSLYDVTITFIINKIVTNTTWQSLGIGIQLLIVSVVRDRVEQVGNKLYFCVTLLLTSWFDEKQRHRSTIPTLVMYAVMFPLLLATIALASVLSAPMLPLFTLPIFLVGYPRPLRSWPGPVGQSASECGDTVFKKHAALELAHTLQSSFAGGSLGKLLSALFVGFFYYYKWRLSFRRLCNDGRAMNHK
jgi:hypothetical protein